MKSFTDFLAESFDTPYPWRRVFTGLPHSFSATFDVPAGPGTPTPLQYTVRCSRQMDQRIPGTPGFGDLHPWELSFHLVGITDSGDPSNPKHQERYGIMRTGHAFTIFATVVSVLKAFIVAHRPLVIHFSAMEASRAKLYDRLIPRVAGAISGYRGIALTAAMKNTAFRKQFNAGEPVDWLTPGNYVIVKQEVALATLLSITLTE